MTKSDRLRMITLMVLSGGYGTLVGLQFAYRVAVHGTWDDVLIAQFVYLSVIFWTAAECYGVRLKLSRSNTENARLTTALEAHARRIEDERR